MSIPSEIPPLKYSCGTEAFFGNITISSISISSGKPIKWCLANIGQGWNILTATDMNMSVDKIVKPSIDDKWRYLGLGKWEFANEADYVLFKLTWTS